LVSIERRGCFAFLDHLVIGAYAHPGDRPLDWGSGGPECWPAVKPYHTPAGSQDQRGFHIYDWYLAIARAVIGDARPLLLFGMSDGIAARYGSSSGKTVAIHRLIAIAQALVANSCINAKQFVRPIAGESLDPLPSQVLAGFFDDLTGDSQWFDPKGSRGLFSEALALEYRLSGEFTAPFRRMVPPTPTADRALPPFSKVRSALQIGI
jgi:hypothetical protein